MLKDTKALLMLGNSALLPISLMLYLYNQNAKHLLLSQVVIAALLFAVFSSSIFILLLRAYHSEQVAFAGAFTCSFLLFSYNNIYEKHLFAYMRGHLALLAIFAIAYIAAYTIHLIIKKVKFNDLPEFITIVLIVIMVINLIGFAKNSVYWKETSGDYEHKTSFITDSALPSPNIYWILCDGMLGFDAMEKYFKDSQTEFTIELKNRGFTIDRGAKFESGHVTNIAIPELMCPDYCDKYMKKILADHDAAIDLKYSSDTEMFNARYHNETIKAFAAKGYTTISMSVDDSIFFPTTDYFYYVAAHYGSGKDLEKLPYYVGKSVNTDKKFYESRFSAIHLGGVFLAGIPDMVFDKAYKRNVVHYNLSVNTTVIRDQIPTAIRANSYSIIINSLYDSLHRKDVLGPKFTLLHAYMAHFPICFDENGNMVKRINHIDSYPAHHTFAARTLVKMIDLIIDADQDAVIVLVADHGLHGQTQEQISQVFDTPEAALDIWNSVISAIRVPEQYKNGEEHYAKENPLNLSRYLVNSFVGKNYEYFCNS